MLLSIFIKNFGIIDQLNIDFQDGFNVLTGETGSGKSIIIDALQAALGGRTSAGQIRTGAKKALIQATFAIGGIKELALLLEEMGFDDLEDEIIVMTREITRTGKNLCRINGQTVTLGYYRKIGGSLADMHMQPETNSLLSQEKQRQLLDRFAGEKALAALAQVNLLYTRWRDARNNFEKLTAAAGDRARRIDLLRYQIEDIQQANLATGEDIALEDEKIILSNAEKIITLVTEAYTMLYEGKGSQYSALDLLSRTLENLRSLVSLDRRNEPLLVSLENIFYQAEDTARELARYRDGMDFSPSRLEAVEERLEQIKKLKKKYGGTIPAIYDYLEAVQKELALLENMEQSLEKFLQELTGIESEYNKAAGILGAARRKAAKELEVAVQQELLYLEMGRVEFKVTFSDVDGPVRDGLERLAFMISTNPGEPLKPLSKIASGGELTRIMLALKALLADADGVPVLVFDEADTGIGGRALQAVAEKMLQLGRNHQVICITHSAQVACLGQAHYRIVKEYDGARTTTRAEQLNPEERLEELARMLDGSEVTEITLRHARQMLRSSSEK
ncbi:MAG: DNA repair protein RecN [Desulfotomaculaceae bacterium]|nr:DNA repair protein RecN [Desulfotomaculaceae bacterium]MDD4766939.1 DNA repair protein RecN [Desulfotomaculaceae bacterium]